MASQFLPARELFVVDDDAAMRDALAGALTIVGYRVSVFADAMSFMAAARLKAPAGVLLDLHLPDKSGLDVLKELNARNFPAPIFIITGDSDVACAVEAVKNGAYDYILKPFESRDIANRLGAAITVYAKRDTAANGRNGIGVEFPGYTRLTPREREVLAQIAAGASNKEAGRRLGISPRTIEVHRARIMEKIGARNAADLVRIVLGGGHAHAATPAPELVA